MTRRLRPTRRGTILPLLALCLVALIAFTGLAVDLGMIAVSRTQCQNAADVAALVGARNLNNKDGVADTNRTDALAKARAVAETNPRMSGYITDSEVTSVVAGQYKYDTSTQKFSVSYPGSIASGDSWSAVKVTINVSQPTYFMKVFGVTAMPTGATATAVHRPRDMAFVLDFTGSMTFGSTPNWPYDVGFGGDVEGLMNPDPAYPQFGHYARYTYYQTATPTTTAAGASAIASRPNPLQMKATIQDPSGGYAPNNHTMTSAGGPPMAEDFITIPGDPGAGTVNPTTATIKNAFKMWSPTQTAAADTSTLTPATFDWTSYDASTGACPAPTNFATQSDSPVTYVGDKWPRTDGTRGAQASAWSTKATSSRFNDNGAQTLTQFLYDSYSVTGTSGRTNLNTYTLPATTGLPSAYATSLAAGGGSTAKNLLPTSNQRTKNGVDGGTTNGSYLDIIWERYGYDLDVSRYRGGNTALALVGASSRFQGYSMGPGYWGKTFFVWPPDPRYGVYDASGNVTLPDVTSPDASNPAFDTNGRPMCDWRRRFFLRGDGAAFDPQRDDINAILFSASAGHVLNPVTSTVTAGYSTANCPGYYEINYAAVIAWLKSGPQVLPTNLRSGRLLYYSSMPADLKTGSTGDSNDRTFLREYVHYVLGVGEFDSSNAPLAGWDYTPSKVMAGVESRNTFGGLSNSATGAFTPGGFGKVPNPQPYMAYTDNVNRPRMHFWFGPQSMLHFLRRAGLDRPWWSGTTHEAQCWQLKSAISSVLDDIRKNNPNDYCGIAGFATRDNFNTPMANMGQDWYTLKNVLFFRKDTVADMKANIVSGSNPQASTSTMEHRPYTSGFGNNNTDMIPNAANGTDPNSGMAVAFNLFSSSTTYGYGGRKGASKVVVFETDGVPNNTRKWFITGSGDSTRYYYNSGGGSPTRWAGDTSLNNQARYACEVAKNIVAPMTTSAQSGYSLPNAPARVYSIGFGDIFTGYDGTNFSSMGSAQQDALQFLLRMQQIGGTSPAGDPPAAAMPVEQVITGSYETRLTNLKSALERIAQSGVQVTLIE
jgi:Flp pilus assembly protein TadG